LTAVVTGASGHIGLNLVRALTRRGRRVRAVVHRNRRPLEGMDVEIVPGDVLDPDSLAAAFSDAEIVFHTAGVISIEGDPDGSVRSVNVDGASNAARAALDTGVQRLVHCSSIHSFDLREPGPITETCPRVPDEARRWAYERSKAEGDRVILQHVADGLDAVLVHPTAVIGPLDFGPSRLGEVLIRLRQRKLPALVRGAFDFVDVRDVAEGMVAASELGRTGESYLLAGHHLTVEELARLAAIVTGVGPPRLTVPYRLARLSTPAFRLWARLSRSGPLFTAESLATLHDAPRVDSTKAAVDLGFAARPIEVTIRDTFRWFAEAGLIDPYHRGDGAGASP
jgi:dihydroflavonol-4-reductase